MPRKPSTHLAAHGKHKAASLVPDRVEEALAEFRKLNSREARAAFADYWIGVWAEDFDYAWPMLYELLRIVEEDELYADPQRVGPGAPGHASAHSDKASYASFADYFADRVSRPLERWADLERAYRYAQTYAPGLFHRAFGEALSAAEQAQEAADEESAAHERAIRLADEVTLAGRGEIGRGRGDRTNNIRSINPSVAGDSTSYLRRRLKRSHPDLYRAVDEGSMSAHSAAIRAGFRHRTLSIRIDDPQSAARTLRKHMRHEALLRLAELLTQEDPPEGNTGRPPAGREPGEVT